MSFSGNNGKCCREILNLFETRRRQVISALVCGSMAGMCVIEILRVTRVCREPIGYAVLAGILATLGLFSLYMSELRIRKTLEHLLLDIREVDLPAVDEHPDSRPKNLGEFETLRTPSDHSGSDNTGG